MALHHCVEDAGQESVELVDIEAARSFDTWSLTSSAR